MRTLSDRTANAVMVSGRDRRRQDLILRVFRTHGAQSVVAWPSPIDNAWNVITRYGATQSVVKTASIPADSVNRGYVNELASRLYFEYKDEC